MNEFEIGDRVRVKKGGLKAEVVRKAKERWGFEYFLKIEGNFSATSFLYDQLELIEKPKYKIGDLIKRLNRYEVLDIFINSNDEVVYELYVIDDNSNIFVKEKDLDKTNEAKFKAGDIVNHKDSRVKNDFIVLDISIRDFGEIIYLLKNKYLDKYTRYSECLEKELK